MKYSEIKKVILFCYDIGEEWRDVLEKIQEAFDDFNIGDYRFIKIDEIDNIQIKELKSDPYMLGCFSASFISEITALPEEMIKASQETDLYETIGNWLISDNHIESLQEQYSSADGYGAHFAHYDSECLEDLYDIGYYVFKIS
jgi:hypothetical protein